MTKIKLLRIFVVVASLSAGCCGEDVCKICCIFYTNCDERYYYCNNNTEYCLSSGSSGLADRTIAGIAVGFVVSLVLSRIIRCICCPFKKKERVVLIPAEPLDREDDISVISDGQVQPPPYSTQSTKFNDQAPGHVHPFAPNA